MRQFAYTFRLLLACWVSIICLSAGCSIDKRKFTSGTVPSPFTSSVNPQTSVDPNLPGGVAGAVAMGAPLGTTCQGNADCALGNCVDGVCCDSPCTDLCAACNLPDSLGTCSPAANDPLCPQTSCAGISTECSPLGDGQLAQNCDAIGTCRVSARCAAAPAAVGTPCQQGSGTCDGNGACVVANKAVLGATCAQDSDCAEGHCVTGSNGARICCSDACDGMCQACSASGRCEETPETDARCAPVSCPADNSCRDYVDQVKDCRGFGQCKVALDCLSAGNFTSLRPDAQCVCDPSTGGCALAAGVTCKGNTDCASGACVATSQASLLCCATPCGPGLVCKSDGTSCVQCEGSQITCNGEVQQTCSNGSIVTTACANGCTAGTGCNALPGIGQTCDAATGCTAPAVCKADLNGQSRCCVRDCAAEGKVCSVTGSCDCAAGQSAAGASCLLQDGDPCAQSAQCQSGTCVDGVCCKEACNGYCESCQAGTGVCTAIASGQQDPDPNVPCTNGFVCTGTRGACRAITGQPCTNPDGTGCVSGNCEPTPGGGASVCCSQACSGTLGSCRGNGQGCVQCDSASQCGNGCNITQGTCNPLRVLGDTCTTAGQCGSGNCVTSLANGSAKICCGACSAGQVCNAQGQCVQPPSGLGKACAGGGDCASGFCAPNGICCNAACNRVCEQCSATGQCQATASDNRCSPVACDALAVGCKTSTRITTNLCRAPGACKTASDCSITNIPDGTPCGNSAAGLICQQGNCTTAQVLCGQTPCSITQTDQVCCQRGVEFGAQQGYSCEQAFDINTAPVGCSEGGILEPEQPVLCDSPDDCLPGNLCCIDITVNARFAQVSCLPAAMCNQDDPNEPGQLRFAQICQSLSFSAPNSCPAGRRCQGTGDASILPGFQFCGPP
jgi:hypothetical protein